jgi:hypothetical protein
MAEYLQKIFEVPATDYNHTQYENSLCFECPVVAFTVATNVGTAEVPTQFSEVYGVIAIGKVADVANDYLLSCVTDGTITSSAISVQISTTSVADGTYTIPILIVGRKTAADA